MDVEIRLVVLNIDFVIFEYLVGYLIYVFIVWFGFGDEEVIGLFLFDEVVIVIIDLFVFVFGNFSFVQ